MGLNPHLRYGRPRPLFDYAFVVLGTLLVLGLVAWTLFG